MARAIRWRPTRADDGTPRPSRPGSVASTATGSRPCDPATEVARGSAMGLTRSSAFWPNGPARPSAIRTARRHRTAARNFALLRKIALNLVARDRTTQTSLRGRRKKAAWNDAYMFQIIARQTHA